jgi:hypothetical protein
MERLRPGSWLPLPALRTAQLSTSPAAKVSKPAACGGAEARHETQQRRTQQQALTQAPSAKQQAEQEQAGNRSAPQAARLGLAVSPLLASGFWLLPPPRRPPPKFLSLRRRRHSQRNSATASINTRKCKPVAAQSGRFWLRLRRPPKFLSLRRSKSTQQQQALTAH